MTIVNSRGIMKKSLIIIYLALFGIFSLFLTHCTNATKAPSLPITESQARGLAVRELEAIGLKASDYTISVVLSQNKAKWRVTFDAGSAVPGGKHVVYVDRLSGEAIFVRGE